MSNIIEKYINEIRKDKICNSSTNFEETIEWLILGDGEGDFEEHSSNTTKKCIINYIEHCKEQIKLAEELNSNLEVEEVCEFCGSADCSYREDPYNAAMGGLLHECWICNDCYNEHKRSI